MAKNSVAKTFAIGAVIASAAGYLAGILSAPNEGKKTRKKLKKSANRSISDVEKQLKTLHTELGELVGSAHANGSKQSEKAGKKVSSAIDSAHSAKDKLREVLSSIHEGEASDKELQKALDDARAAVSHLKKFLKR